MIPASSTGVYELQNYRVLSWPQAKLIPVPGFYNGAFKGQLKPHHLRCFPDHLLPHRARLAGSLKGWEEGFPKQWIFYHSSIYSHLHKFRKHRLYWTKYPHNHKGCISKLTAWPGKSPKPHTPGLVSAFPRFSQGLSPCRSCSSLTRWPGLLIVPNQLLQKTNKTQLFCQDT